MKYSINSFDRLPVKFMNGTEAVQITATLGAGNGDEIVWRAVVDKEEAGRIERAYEKRDAVEVNITF